MSGRREIKVREGRKTVRTIERSGDRIRHLKSSVIRTRDSFKKSMEEEPLQPSQYAEDRIRAAADKTVKKAESGARTAAGKARNRILNRITGAKNGKRAASVSEISQGGAKPLAGKAGKSSKIQTAGRRTGKTAKASVRRTGGGIRTAGRTVRTARQTSGAAVRTAKATANVTKRTAEGAARAAKAGAALAKKAAAAVAKAAVAAAKAIAAAVKSLIASTKALLAAGVSGGGVAAVIIVILCVLLLLFGLFFWNTDDEESGSIRETIRSVNEEYQERIDEIKEKADCDTVRMNGSAASWKDVIIVYLAAANDGTDLMALNREGENALRDLFWKMTDISSEIKEEAAEPDGGDEEGRTILVVSVSHKTPGEIAEELDFTEEQKTFLKELLQEKDHPVWRELLYGIGIGDQRIVEVARSQIGNVGGEPYWSWYGFSSRVEWCACFVSWCANECGYIEEGIIPIFSTVISGVKWFRDHDQWMDGREEPGPGMIIFFDWDHKGDCGDQDGSPDHTGIVDRVENDMVYVIEGNTTDSCRERHYPVGYYEILGYGMPEY